jgi:tetratricopeptide (TPR) repeat protein
VAVRGFLDALGVPPGRVPADPHAQAAMFRSAVAGRRMLLVVDNAADTGQVLPLLPGSDACTVLVTSRNRLPGLVTGHSAHHVPLDVLTDAEARALLADRLGAERVAAEPDAVDELIRSCGGMPLALSIIAGRARLQPHLPLGVHAAELREDGLVALDDDDPSASLPAVLSWSYRALTAGQASVFGLLGVAPGPHVGVHAAAALTGLPSGEARAVLRALERASLLTQDAHGRYRMHDLIRRYAAEIARRDAGAVDAALCRVVDFYLRTARAGDRLLDPQRQPMPLDPPAHDESEPSTSALALTLTLADEAAALAWFDVEHPCLLAAQHTAFAQGRHLVAWWLAPALDTFHIRRGHLHDHLAVWRVGLAAAGHIEDAPATTVAHRFVGQALAELGRHDEALDHLYRALDSASGDPATRANVHRGLAWAWARQGDDRKACEHTAAALEIYRARGNTVGEANALNALGWHSALLGEHDTARAHCAAALALHRAHNDRDGEAATLDSLGYIAHETGRHADAIEHYRQALALFRDFGDTYSAADSLHHLGHPHAALGDHAQARAVWEEALELYRAHGRDSDAERVRDRLASLP